LIIDSHAHLLIFRHLREELLRQNKPTPYLKKETLPRIVCNKRTGESHKSNFNNLMNDECVRREFVVRVILYSYWQARERTSKKK
jgi:hypothetical protein